MPPASTDALIGKLRKSYQLVGPFVHRGASIKPPGDVLVIYALNRDADRVMRLADDALGGAGLGNDPRADEHGVDPEHERAVSKDVEEALWEESETSLRHQGRPTSNFLALMALDGAVAATGFMVSGSSQTISLIAASIIGRASNRSRRCPWDWRWAVVGRGLLSTGVGYLVLALGAGLAFALLRLIGVGTVEEFLGSSETKVLTDPTLREVLLSSFGALAGIVMIVAYRRSVIAGPLIVLAIIPAAAMVGIALAAGRLIRLQGHRTLRPRRGPHRLLGHCGRGTQARGRTPPQADAVVGRRSHDPRSSRQDVRNG